VAISFVGSHVGTHAATSAQSVAFTNLRDASNAQPTLQQGDMVVVAINQGSTVDRTQAQLTPSGYTPAHTDLYQNDSNDVNLQVSYKFMGASPDANVSIPASDSTANGVAYDIHVFRGVDPNNPLDVAAAVTGGINTGVANAAAITPSSSGAWIMAVGAAAVAAGAVFTNPTGMSTTTNHFRSATITSTTVDANIGAALKIDWSSGAFDPAAFGGSTSTNTGSWAAVTLALRPLLDSISATGSPSLGTLLSTSAAKALVEGVGGGTLNAFGSSAAATVRDPAIHATGSPAPATFASASAAKITVEATGIAVFDQVLSSAAADAHIHGLGSGVLNTFSSSSIGKIVVEGAANAALAELSLASSAKTIVQASSARSMGAFTGSGMIDLVSPTVTVTGAPSIGLMAIAATASARVSMSASAGMQPLLSEAAAEALVEGLGSGSLNALAGSGDAKVRVAGISASDPHEFASSGAIATRVAAFATAGFDPFTASGSIGGQRTELSGVATFGQVLLESAVVLPIEVTGGATMRRFGRPPLVPASRCVWPARPTRATAGACADRRLAPALQRRSAP